MERESSFPPQKIHPRKYIDWYLTFCRLLGLYKHENSKSHQILMQKLPVCIV